MRRIGEICFFLLIFYYAVQTEGTYPPKSAASPVSATGIKEFRFGTDLTTLREFDQVSHLYIA
ncbi:MAG: hypothetical protein AB1656_27520 [Candidatus Omnitrophota bacterium]